MDVNKIFILGRLGKDPEIRYTPNGATVCNFSIATSRSYKRGDEWERKSLGIALPRGEKLLKIAHGISKKVIAYTSKAILSMGATQKTARKSPP